MTTLTVNDGIRNQILEVDWNSICGSVTSTQDIEDYGDYAIIDDFIENIENYMRHVFVILQILDQKMQKNLT